MVPPLQCLQFDCIATVGPPFSVKFSAVGPPHHKQVRGCFRFSVCVRNFEQQRNAVTNFDFRLLRKSEDVYLPSMSQILHVQEGSDATQKVRVRQRTAVYLFIPGLRIQVQNQRKSKTTPYHKMPSLRIKVFDLRLLFAKNKIGSTCTLLCNCFSTMLLLRLSLIIIWDRFLQNIYIE